MFQVVARRKRHTSWFAALLAQLAVRRQKTKRGRRKSSKKLEKNGGNGYTSNETETEVESKNKKRGKGMLRGTVLILL